MASVEGGGRGISTTRFTDCFLAGCLKWSNAMCVLKYCSHHSEKKKIIITWFRSLCQLMKDLCIFHEHWLETRVFSNLFLKNFWLKVHSRGLPSLIFISSGLCSSMPEPSACSKLHCLICTMVCFYLQTFSCSCLSTLKNMFFRKCY